jgi:transposase-like protein
MLLNIQHLIDDAKCYAVEDREIRWLDGVKCPHCGSGDIKKRGSITSKPIGSVMNARLVERQFDDLTGTVFEGHHQPLRAWVLCLRFMGLNLSSHQIAAEPDLDRDECRTSQRNCGQAAWTKKPARRVFPRESAWFPSG